MDFPRRDVDNVAERDRSLSLTKLNATSSANDDNDVLMLVFLAAGVSARLNLEVAHVKRHRDSVVPSDERRTRNPAPILLTVLLVRFARSVLPGESLNEVDDLAVGIHSDERTGSHRGIPDAPRTAA